MPAQPTPEEQTTTERQVHARLSAEFRMLSELCLGERVLLRDLIRVVKVRGHALLCILFALPFLQPIPMPGLSTLFGLVIGLAGYRMALGKGPWLPRSVLKRQVPGQTLSKIFSWAAELFERVEKVLHPRIPIFYRLAPLKRINGALLVVLGIFLALPLPPGTNFPPALAVLLLAIGSLEHDGLVLIFGYLMFLLNLMLFIALPIYGAEALVEWLTI